MVIAWPFRGGSSPRGRGKRNDDGRHAPCGGLIPARAGKTSARDDPWLGLTAHPRAGGENLQDIFDLVSAAGSSPRGRGKLDGRERVGLTVRLIPARAGKTKQATKREPPSRAHPRAGGENAPGVQAGTPQAGSSPRGRGKQSTGRAPSNRRGLIPARAGKTATNCQTPTRGQAHPRAGGENFARYSRRYSPLGSSPRGRGKHRDAHPRRRQDGLIPARAGKTPTWSTPTVACWAHPRAGGENSIPAKFSVSANGSSPRGRGKHTLSHGLPRIPRLIPARAGKTDRRGRRR